MVGWLKKMEEKVDLMDLPSSERVRICREIHEALQLIIHEAKIARREKEEEDYMETVEVDEGHVKLEDIKPEDYPISAKPQNLYNQLNRIF